VHKYIGFQLGNCIVQWIISLLIMFWNARTIGICLFCFTGSYQCTSLHISGAHIILWYKPGKINKFGIPEWWFFSPVRFRPLWWTNRKPPFYFNCSCLHPWNWFTAMDASFSKSSDELLISIPKRKLFSQKETINCTEHVPSRWPSRTEKGILAMLSFPHHL
jgi:hypothetical protein